MMKDGAESVGSVLFIVRFYGVIERLPVMGCARIITGTVIYQGKRQQPEISTNCKEATCKSKDSMKRKQLSSDNEQIGGKALC